MVNTVETELWQMTKKEALEAIRVPARQITVKPNLYSLGKAMLSSSMTVCGIPSNEIPGWENRLIEHYEAVVTAYAEGKNVPQEVLAEYDDLEERRA